MKPCLTYQNGPEQGVQRAFGPGAPLPLSAGPCEITCSFEAGKAILTVESGQVLLGQPGRPGGQRVSGQIELRPGDIVILGELRLAYSLEEGEPPSPKKVAAPQPAAPPDADRVVLSRRKSEASEASGPAIVITTERKAAAPPSDAPRPARVLFGFLPPEKQKNAYYQLLMVFFLLLLSFSVGLVWGSSTKIKEKPNTELEPFIRHALYKRGKALGWSYPKLLRELRKAEQRRARPLAVWWLSMPRPRKGRR